MRVRLHTATFFGYAQLRTAGCEGDAWLRTVDQHSVSELFDKKWCWWKLCLRSQCIVKDPPVNSRPTKIGCRPTWLAEYSFVPYPPASRASMIAVCPAHHTAGRTLLLSNKHTTLPSSPGNLQLPQPTVAPNTHLLIRWLLLKYIHLVLHACLSTAGPLMEPGSASLLVVWCSSFCWPKWRRQQGIPTRPMSYQ